MPKHLLPLALSVLLIVELTALFLLNKNPETAYSAAGHIVISEIQIAGGVSTDEFVELYNPTESSVDLSGWRLTRKTPTEGNLVASMSGSIPAHGYFLIAHPNYDGLVNEDTVYSATSSSISGNNTVILYSDAGVTVIDKVGLGSSSDSETSPIASPSANGSVERKAFQTSTSDSMGTGGFDETAGNGEDTDNNIQDFIERIQSDPQNTSSNLEPAFVPTPTISPTPTATMTPTPSITENPTPTVSPTQTVTLTPTETPTQTPTATTTPTNTPTPTLTPTETPNNTPSPTVSPTETLTPTATTTPTTAPTNSLTPTVAATLTPTTMVTPTVTVTPTPTPSGTVIGVFPTRGGSIVCLFSFKRVRGPFFPLFVPQIHCSRITNN